MFDNGDITRLENKVDKIVDDIGEIKIIMARNTVSLEEHIKRTNLLEEEVKRLDEDVRPVKDHVTAMKHSGKLIYTVIKLLAALASIIGVIAALMKYSS